MRRFKNKLNKLLKAKMTVQTNEDLRQRILSFTRKLNNFRQSKKLLAFFQWLDSFDADLRKITLKTNINLGIRSGRLNSIKKLKIHRLIL